LVQHFVSGRVQISKHFDGDACISNQRRNCLHDLPVFRRFFPFGEPVSGLNQVHDFRVLGDQRRICGLPVHKTDQLLDSCRLLGIAAVNQDLRMWALPRSRCLANCFA
jgi:hypothetical protein